MKNLQHISELKNALIRRNVTVNDNDIERIVKFGIDKYLQDEGINLEEECICEYYLILTAMREN